MPIGCCSLAPAIATRLQLTGPRSVLDLCIGMGFYGAVVRQRVDIGVRPWRPRLVGVVRDVRDAGGTVFATLAVGMTAGKSLRAAGRAAMGAAGRQITFLGIGTVASERRVRCTWC